MPSTQFVWTSVTLQRMLYKDGEDITHKGTELH